VLMVMAATLCVVVGTDAASKAGQERVGEGGFARCLVRSRKITCPADKFRS